MTVISTAALDSIGEPHREGVLALVNDCHRAVDTIMTNHYGPDWARSADLPDEAYTAETGFHRWFSELLDHIDAGAQPIPDAPS